MSCILKFLCKAVLMISWFNFHCKPGMPWAKTDKIDGLSCSLIQNAEKQCEIWFLHHISHHNQSFSLSFRTVLHWLTQKYILTAPGPLSICSPFHCIQILADQSVQHVYSLADLPLLLDGMVFHASLFHQTWPHQCQNGHLCEPSQPDHVYPGLKLKWNRGGKINKLNMRKK